MNEQEALAKLRAMLPPGTTVYTVLRHVSQSGMTRAISPIVVIDGKPADISWLLAKVGFKFNQRYGGITVRGAGMDMGFHLVYTLSHLVYTLSRKLYPDGFECFGEPGCPEPHHSDGGYALYQRWL